MDFPRIEDLRGREAVGSGPCGTVYRAHDAAGRCWAVKHFRGESVNVALLRETTARLAAAGWPGGVMPVVAADFEGWPVTRVTPWLAETGVEGVEVPRNLQQRLDGFPVDDAWRVVRGLAAALEVFHQAGVAHGNLKPGNVFFDEEERVMLTDWALGNMPGIRRIDYTDAYLYQAPEQLCDPSAYRLGAAYRWDVFAFGVLAFRLLTGRFPRCHETFIQLAPGGNEMLAEGVHTDLAKVAWRLESQPEVRWPDEPSDAKEAHGREWITRCLAIDPALRPATMAEVARGFAMIDEAAAAEGLRDEMLDLRRHAALRARRAWGAAAIFAVAATGLGGWGWMNGRRAQHERIEADALVRGLEGERDTALRERQRAGEAAAKAMDELETATARWRASRQMVDRLFAWTLEAGRAELPPFEGRDVRLSRLERSFETFIAESAGLPSLEVERARAKLALAEIALWRGDATMALTRLDAAAEAWHDRKPVAEDASRLAADRLWLAIRLHETGDPRAAEAFARARLELSALPRADGDSERVDAWLAMLDFREAGWLAARGEEDKAAGQLVRAVQTLIRLTEQRPDAMAFHSALAEAYQASAGLTELATGPEGAVAQWKLAAMQWEKLLEKNPGDVAFRSELAGCYGALAEAALLAGNPAEAEASNGKAVELLEAVLRDRPDHFDSMIRLAACRGRSAGYLRDRGQTDEALKSLDEGIRSVDAVLAAQPTHATAAFQLALLRWRKGMTLATHAEGRGRAIELLGKAAETLRSLEKRPSPGPLQPEQLRRSLAYLLGDLGTLQWRASDNAGAKRTFAGAVEVWEALAKARPQREEYREGLAWCRQRLLEIQ